MLAFFLILLGVPLVIAAFAFVFLNGITWKELACIAGVQLVIAGSSAGICSCANKHDVEVWNGRVASKNSQHVSCSHSYPCNCHEVCSGSGKNRSCSTHCDTCYEHSYDVDWEVHTTNGEEVDIDRVDRQGIYEPPRFRATVIGEPTSLTHSYENYVKDSPGTLFRHQGLKEKYAASIPTYPQNVFDYYRLNRLVTVGFSVPDAAAWNSALSDLNADLGRSKQANIIVVIVKDTPDDWYYALEESWIGGKKNDVILVVSVDADMKPQWATVMCWTTNELFKVKLRDDVMNDPTLTRDAVIADLRTNVSQYFVRKPMSDFEYLSSSITPSPTEWWVTMIIGLIAAVGMIVFFQMNDVFNEEDHHTGIFSELSDRGRPRRGKHKKPWHHRIKRLFTSRPWEDA
jgi:hypothetical protein